MFAPFSYLSQQENFNITSEMNINLQYKWQNLPLYAYIQRLLDDKTRSLVMPVPCFNVLNGGVHSGNTLAFQEIMICPTGASTTTEAIRMGNEVYHALKKVIVEKHSPSGKSV